MMELERYEPERYVLNPTRICSEDILFCVDIDAESLVEMKPTGRPCTRLESIKMAILLFVQSKLSINPDHRFALATISKTAALIRKEFTSDVDTVSSILRGISATSTSGPADLTYLFRIAAHEAKKSRVQNRILRVILIYCRSSTKPQHQWPLNQKIFTFDVLYIHDKPGPENCPQQVYDVLVETLEHVSEYEGYILETGQGVARAVCKQMCVLLAHPQQRTAQEFIDFPKTLAKKLPAAETPTADEAVPVSSQSG